MHTLSHEHTTERKFHKTILTFSNLSHLIGRFGCKSQPNELFHNSLINSDPQCEKHCPRVSIVLTCASQIRSKEEGGIRALDPAYNPQLLLSGRQTKRGQEMLEHALLRKITAEKREWDPCFKTQQQPILSSQKFPRGHRPHSYWLCKDSNVQGSFCSGLENEDFYLLSTSKDVQGPLQNFPNPSSYSWGEQKSQELVGFYQSRVGLGVACQVSGLLRVFVLA